MDRKILKFPHCVALVDEHLVNSSNDLALYNRSQLRRVRVTFRCRVTMFSSRVRLCYTYNWTWNLVIYVVSGIWHFYVRRQFFTNFCKTAAKCPFLRKFPFFSINFLFGRLKRAPAATFLNFDRTKIREIHSTQVTW